jgi:opacity protein-like surface antigen
MLDRIRKIDLLCAYMVLAAIFILAASFAASAETISKGSPNTRGPIVKNPVPAAVAKPAKGWTGIRVGAFGGWAAEIQRQVDDTGPVQFDLTNVADGFLYGALVGYDHQLGKSVVWRVSTDYSWVHNSAREFATPFGMVGGGLDIKRMWSAMTGPGLLVTDKALVYAGAGYTTVYSDAFMGQGLLGKTGGLTLGVGIEVMADTGFSLNVEYRWTDLGNDTMQWGANPASVADADTNLHQVRAGVTFKFDSPLK